jgi:rare lipoprotein A
MLERSSLLNVAVLMVPLLVGCGSTATATKPQSPATNQPMAVGSVPAQEQNEERGQASFYSDRLAGRSTASGEPYDPKELTAAHRTLPFGAIVRILRPKNGRVVEVRINDRGPHKQGRIVDLSRRGAEEIGLVRDGIGDVVLTIVSLPPVKPKKKRR